MLIINEMILASIIPYNDVVGTEEIDVVMGENILVKHEMFVGMNQIRLKHILTRVKISWTRFRNFFDYKEFRLPKTLFIQCVCFYCTCLLLVGAIPSTNSEPAQ